MRVTSMVAGLALVLAACAGGDNADNQATTADTGAMGTPAATTPAGTTHEVQMTMVDGQPRFVPAQVNVKAGDVVRFVNKEGGPHNVAFWADSMPAGGAEAIQVADPMAALTSQMLMEANAAVTVTVAANAPTGTYKFVCQPHQAQGMTGALTVQ